MIRYPCRFWGNASTICWTKSEEASPMQNAKTAKFHHELLTSNTHNHNIIFIAKFHVVEPAVRILLQLERIDNVLIHHCSPYVSCNFLKYLFIWEDALIVSKNAAKCGDTLSCRSSRVTHSCIHQETESIVEVVHHYNRGSWKILSFL